MITFLKTGRRLKSGQLVRIYILLYTGLQVNFSFGFKLRVSLRKRLRISSENLCDPYLSNLIVVHACSGYFVHVFSQLIYLICKEKTYLTILNYQMLHILLIHRCALFTIYTYHLLIHYANF